LALPLQALAVALTACQLFPRQADEEPQGAALGLLAQLRLRRRWAQEEGFDEADAGLSHIPPHPVVLEADAINLLLLAGRGHDGKGLVQPGLTFEKLLERPGAPQEGRQVGGRGKEGVDVGIPLPGRPAQLDGGRQAVDQVVDVGQGALHRWPQFPVVTAQGAQLGLGPRHDLLDRLGAGQGPFLFPGSRTVRRSSRQPFRRCNRPRAG
jgi:hypothetical protein